MGNPDFTDASLQQAMKMAQSPAGKQLIQLLQANGGETLRTAMEQAASGDYAMAKKAISSLLENPDAQKLMKQMGGNP